MTVTARAIRFNSAHSRSAAVVMAAMLFATPVVRAQSAQPYSLQIGVLFTSFDNGNRIIGGVGAEPQFRINRLYSTEGFGALSLGIGGQYTTHSSGGQNLKIAGAFLEPRWVPAFRSNVIFPYVSARLALLNQSSNFGSGSSGTGFGAGGGLAIKLTKTANFDAGVQLVRQKFGEFTRNSGGRVTFNPFTTYAAKAGVSFGFPR